MGPMIREKELDPLSGVEYPKKEESEVRITVMLLSHLGIYYDSGDDRIAIAEKIAKLCGVGVVAVGTNEGRGECCFSIESLPQPCRGKDQEAALGGIDVIKAATRQFFKETKGTS